MESVLLCVGKTDQGEIQQLIEQYSQRLKHYTKFSIQIVEDIKNSKNLSEKLQKEKEGDALKKQLKPGDRVILLDEGGKQFSSLQFSEWMNKQMASGLKRLVFVVGGPYGFSPAIYALAQQKISLSPMTFSHQMVRLFFVEQLYRAHTILKNEPYHHQ
ncbi:MAG: 23S rRNA (pseudouridine(1915)-N(3))-methyltransferase RlmH [Flavobacteriaceae bacterium]|nr:23S rRNA (pseudouridine(1915)-N(3))-methyltransferase RlmH [Flavobacteriaceae bacterium]